MEIYKKLLRLQQSFKADKSAYNSFANFAYRNIEAMLDKLKPLLEKEGLVIIFSEEMHQCANDIMSCECMLIDTEDGEKVSNKSCVRVDPKYKGMSEAQASGATITYLRKYTLGGLLAVGAEKDPDSMAPNSAEDSWEAKINACNTKEELWQLWNTIPIEKRAEIKELFTTKKKKII